MSGIKVALGSWSSKSWAQDRLRPNSKRDPRSQPCSKPILRKIAKPGLSSLATITSTPRNLKRHEQSSVHEASTLNLENHEDRELPALGAWTLFMTLHIAGLKQPHQNESEIRLSLFLKGPTGFGAWRGSGVFCVRAADGLHDVRLEAAV